MGELARRNVFAQGLAECTVHEDEVLRNIGLRPLSGRVTRTLNISMFPASHAVPLFQEPRCRATNGTA